MTKQGKLIFEYIKNNPDKHLNSEEIYQELKIENKKIGLATVYRNLNKLVEQKVVREINLEKQGIRYDYYQEEHYHFVCSQCKKIENIYFHDYDKLIKELELDIHSKVEGMQLVAFGTCQKCQRNNDAYK